MAVGTVADVNTPSPWDRRPVYLMSAVGALVKIQFGELLAPYGLLPQHFGVLRRIAVREGSTQQDMADAMRFRRAAMVGLVDDLEAKGLLERRRHPLDRRANALHLTAAGRRLLAEVATASDALEADLLAPLSAEARSAFLDCLLQVAQVAGVTDGIYPQPKTDSLGDDPATHPLNNLLNHPLDPVP